MQPLCGRLGASFCLHRHQFSSQHQLVILRLERPVKMLSQTHVDVLFGVFPSCPGSCSVIAL